MTDLHFIATIIADNSTNVFAIFANVLAIILRLAINTTNQLFPFLLLLLITLRVSVIILSMMLSSCSRSSLKINLQISSPSHILRDAFVLWLTTSNWSHTNLEFAGAFNV